MHRYLAPLSLIPTIFTLITVILINVGGGSNDKYSSGVESNPQFNLLNWNYSITPKESMDSYSYHLYLNRLCSGSRSRISTKNSDLKSYIVIPSYCVDIRKDGSLSAETIHAPNLEVKQLRVFRFDALNLKAPFAFYVMTGILTFTLIMVIILGLAGSCMEGRAISLIGLVVSAATATFIVIASGVVSWQMLHLKNQIQNDTIRSRTVTTLNYSTSERLSTEYTIEIQNVSLGTTVLGLTWSAVVAMLLGTGMWAISWMARDTSTKEGDMKEVI